MYTAEQIQNLPDVGASPHQSSWNKMVKDAWANSAASFEDAKYWPPAERFGRVRLCRARRTAEGVETMIETKKFGRVTWSSEWS